MAGNYEQLKDIINNPTQHSLPAWDNNSKEIEGLVMKQYLLSIINSLTVGYQFMGVASENTNAGTPDQNVAYICGAGTYPNFNGATVDVGCIGIIKYNGEWSFDTIRVDNILIKDSSDFINSVGDLEIVDEQGYVLIRFINGQIKTKNFNSSYTVEQADNDSLADFDISDQTGNVIMRLIEGHIVTKNFDSRNLQIEEKQNTDTLPIWGFTTNGNIVIQTGIFEVPYLGVKLKINTPTDIKTQIMYGPERVITASSNWLSNGDVFNIPTDAIVMKVSFKKENQALSVAEIETLLNNGDIKITYTSDDLPMLQRNAESEKRTKSAMLDLATAPTIQKLANITYHCHPTFVHVSDIHGDAKRLENAVEYANEIGADAICLTGDNVTYEFSDGVGFIEAVIKKYPQIPIFTCIGNHECINVAQTGNNNAALFTKFMAPFAVQGGYKYSNNVPTLFPYYYADISARKMRIICINQFNDAVYGSQDRGGQIGSNQIEWLIQTIKSIPSGYGFVILMHSPEDAITVPADADSFNQTITYNGSDYAGNGMYTSIVRPIEKIVDTFISRGVYSLSYQENNGGLVSTTVDFRDTDPTIEFIGFLCGHRHRDRIGYNQNAINRQCVLDITTTNAHYARGGEAFFANESDLPRGAAGVVQDSFNVYVFDRIHKTIKIVRVGSDINMDFIERKQIILSYQ